MSRFKYDHQTSVVKTVRAKKETGRRGAQWSSLGTSWIPKEKAPTEFRKITVDQAEEVMRVPVLILT